MKSITTYLMFNGKQFGKAEAAIKFYTTLFDDSKILDITYYSSEDDESEGNVKTARFTINGREFVAMDSSKEHKFNFTPSISLYVECESELEINKFYSTLSEGGEKLMPLDDYGFSKQFGWLNDQFGVSWQLNLQY